MTQPPPTPPSGEPPPADTPPVETVLGAPAGSGTPTANPLSRLSTQMIVGLVAVAVVVLGGLGVLIGQWLGNSPKPVPVPITLPPPTTTPPTPTPTTSPPTTVPPTYVVTIASGAVTVPVLNDWTAKKTDTGAGVTLNANCCFAFLQVEQGTNVDPTATVANELQNWVSSQNGYSQVTSDSPVPVGGAQGLGSLTASTERAFQAVWTGSGGSEFESGILFAFVRSDGSVLEIQMDAAGSSSDDAHNNYQSSADLQTILNEAVHSFAGQ